MKPNRSLNPLLIALVCLSLACAFLSAPVERPQASPIPASPTALPPGETVPAGPTGTNPPPSATATEAPAALPTATLFAEEQLHTVTDESGAIQANLPILWDDLRTLPWTDAKGETLGVTFMASTDVDAFLAFRAEGVAISVSSRLPVGYIQLLEQEYELYIAHCEDTYKTRWELDDHPVYRGEYVVFNKCEGQRDTWLSLLSLVNKQDAGQYIVRVVGYDMIPLYGGSFRDMILDFKVFPENLP
jgi:hypothetical protein